MTARKGFCGLAAVVTVFTVALLVATAAAAAPPGGWPNKKGELCWVATAIGPEYSLVIAQITNMGNDHYLYHGQAYRLDENLDPVPDVEIQPFSGNAEIAGGTVIGQLTKVEILERLAPDPDLLETYTGIFRFDLATLEGVAEGIISTCPVGGSPSCDSQINTGPIPLWPVPCP